MRRSVKARPNLSVRTAMGTQLQMHTERRADAGRQNSSGRFLSNVLARTREARTLPSLPSEEWHWHCSSCSLPRRTAGVFPQAGTVGNSIHYKLATIKNWDLDS